MVKCAHLRPITSAVIILFCFMAALCEGFDVQAAGVAAVGISREWHPASEQLGLFFSIGNLGLFLGALIGGRLADHLGRKAVLVGSIATFGLFSLVMTQAWNMQSLTWMRALTGLGLGGAMPNLIALAAESSGQRSRNAGIATTYVGMPIGGAMASVLVAFAAIERWRWIFLIGGSAPVIIAGAMAIFMPAAAQQANAELPVEGSQHGALRELLGSNQLQRTLLLWAGFFLMQLTFQIMLNWLPLLMQARGLPKNEVAFAQTGFNLGGAAAALLMGFLLDRRVRLLSIATTVAALPAVLLLLANVPKGSSLLMVLPLFLGGGILSFQVILYGAANLSYPTTARGLGIGAAVGVGRLGAIAGPAFAASLLSSGSTPQQVLTAVLPLAVACGICVATLGWQAFRAQLAQTAASVGAGPDPA